MLSTTFYEANTILVSKSNRGKFQVTLIMNINVKTLSKVVANQKKNYVNINIILYKYKN